jgi:hypothetical protein
VINIYVYGMSYFEFEMLRHMEVQPKAEVMFRQYVYVLDVLRRGM